MKTRLVLALFLSMSLASCATTDVDEVLDVIEDVGEVLGDVAEVGKIVGCTKNPGNKGCPAVPAAAE